MRFCDRGLRHVSASIKFCRQGVAAILSDFKNKKASAEAKATKITEKTAVGGGVEPPRGS